MKPATYYAREGRTGRLFVEQLDKGFYLVSEGFSVIRFPVGDAVFDSRQTFPTLPSDVGEVSNNWEVPAKPGTLSKSWRTIADLVLTDSGYLAQIDGGLAAVLLSPKDHAEPFTSCVNMRYLNLIPAEEGEYTFRASGPMKAVHVYRKGEQVAVIMPMMVGETRRGEIRWKVTR